jgi:hypothetical protein
MSGGPIGHEMSTRPGVAPGFFMRNGAADFIQAVICFKSMFQLPIETHDQRIP